MFRNGGKIQAMLTSRRSLIQRLSMVFAALKIDVGVVD
jgi:hypothetical protein